ncbi:MAG: hypothetical protein OEQ13_05840 [Acidobacteriota bacterium]|nr:hypothetical protein [Acidobacteriota bacterium]
MTVLARKASIGAAVSFLVLVLLSAPAFGQELTRPVPEIVSPSYPGFQYEDSSERVLYYAKVVNLRRLFAPKIPENQPIFHADDQPTSSARRPQGSAKASMIGATSGINALEGVSTGNGLLHPHTGATAPTRPTAEQLVKHLRSVQDALGL